MTYAIRHRLEVSLFGLIVLAICPCAMADDLMAGGASLLCRNAAKTAERVTGVPDQLLDAVSRVESGRSNPADGAMRAWPWTINAQGIGHFYATKGEAIAAASRFRAEGVQSIDVGCMQINLMYHPQAFSSLDEAFDPQANAIYAARLLVQLFQQTGSWPHAAAAYHSQTPELGNDYQRKVLDAWAQPEDGAAPRQRSRKRDTASPANLSEQVASLGAGIAPIPPTGGPVMGGLGRIIRSTPPLRTGIAGRGLDGYRSVPITMAAFLRH